MAVLGTTTRTGPQHESVLGNYPNVKGHPGDLHRKWAEKQKKKKKSREQTYPYAEEPKRAHLGGSPRHLQKQLDFRAALPSLPEMLATML